MPAECTPLARRRHSAPRQGPIVSAMAGTREQAALLALLRARRTGWREVTDRVEACGSAIEVLKAADPGQGELFAEAPDAEQALDDAQSAIAGWEAQGIRLVTILDDDYPGQLLTVHQRPPFLFYRGTLDPGDANGVAVVGTRKPSPEGLRRAGDIAAGLAERRVPVISGLAAGIDAAAHRAAMGVGGRTVAVIGTGLQRSYPAENASLQEDLAASHLVLSQFWPNAAPSRTSFPMRNAVMSGYAAATVVVEAAWKSGARMQARLALQHGRPVLLLDSLLVHDWAREYAAQPGTTVVSSADDVLAALHDILRPVQHLAWA